MALNIVEEGLRLKLKDILSEERYSRFIKGVESNMDIYPTVRGKYIVYSHSSDSEYRISYTTDREFRCDCYDYMLRIEQDSDIHRCKHIWRLWVEVNDDLLPAAVDDPFYWLEQQVEDELFDIIEKLDDEPENKEELEEDARLLRALRRRLDNGNRRTVDYESLYSSWKEFRKRQIRRER